MAQEQPFHEKEAAADKHRENALNFWTSILRDARDGQGIPSSLRLTPQHGNVKTTGGLAACDAAQEKFVFHNLHTPEEKLNKAVVSMADVASLEIELDEAQAAALLALRKNTDDLRG